ncbi:DUF1934 domain-containing protein [Sporolactobacillus vineae]|uniref:DUF1934 domain-containing protein n=1 Tax=Sporolactobacillus vineae TaxID=444463 RepID=UPI000287B452|nr:DUF1934 domain-containing protein [Sporolactobacillus vineae]
MKTHNVRIIFTSRTAEDMAPATRSVVDGRLGEGAAGLYLFFSDTVAGAGDVKYTIKIGPDEALLRRSGILALRQPLFLGKRVAGSCVLPAGPVGTQAVAEKIDGSWDSGSATGTASLVYELSLQGQYAGKFYLDFHFAARD